MSDERLSDYQQRRLDLADALRAILPVARRSGDKQREQEIRGLLARLAAGRFQLAVAGQFSRGKTTLMNALLGGSYLPMGAVPMTSGVTTVQYGAVARALVRSRASSLPVEVPVTEVARFVAQASADRTRMQVASVEVEIPAEILRLGFQFVDTPGVRSAITANTAATRRYLPEADAVIFVTGFDSPLTEAEADFLAAAAAHAGKLFLVINKRDLVTVPEATHVTAYVRQWAHENLGPAELPVFGISALHALEAATGTDPAKLAASGIEPFRDALTQFLAAEQGTLALSNVASAAAGLISRQQRDLRLGRLAMDGGPDPQAVAADFDARMRGIRAELNMAGERIAVKVAEVVPGLIGERAAAWQAELRDLIAHAVNAPIGATVSSAGAPALIPLIALERAGRTASAEWLDQRVAEVLEAVTAATAGEIGDLMDLARSPRELGAAIAGLPAFTTGLTGWLAEDLPAVPVPTVGWVLPDPAAARRRRRRGESGTGDISRLVAETLAAAVASFTERAYAACQDAAVMWARLLRQQAERQADAEAAQFRTYLAASSPWEDVVLLANLAAHLAELQESLGAGTRASVTPGSRVDPAAAPGSHGGRCEVCAQMEAALTAYLIERQFLLATNKADQARHARAGGFCTLHTWQYAHMASPVGISAGNAALAGALADALHDITLDSGSSAQIAGAIAALVQPERCDACAVLADRQQQAAARLARQAQSAAPDTLCLRHLAVVLAAGRQPGPDQYAGGRAEARIARHEIVRAQAGGTPRRSYRGRRG